ncbi:MAG TPA: hypothetical protein VGG63_16410 [Steroidobacteraceae bacterium]
MTAIIQQSMPQLRTWLSSADTWKNDGAKAAALMDTMMRWVLPSYGRIDPHMEQAAAAAAEPPKAPPVTPQDVLAAFKGFGAVKASLAGMLERAPPVPAPAEVLPGLARLSETESEVIRHGGIPLEGGLAYLPKAPPMPKRREPGAMPELPKPPIDVQAAYLTPEEIYRAQMRPLPDDDGSAQVVVTPAGPVVRPRW